VLMRSATRPPVVRCRSSCCRSWRRGRKKAAASRLVASLIAECGRRREERGGSQWIAVRSRRFTVGPAAAVGQSIAVVALLPERCGAGGRRAVTCSRARCRIREYKNASRCFGDRVDGSKPPADGRGETSLRFEKKVTDEGRGLRHSWPNADTPTQCECRRKRERRLMRASASASAPLDCWTVAHLWPLCLPAPLFPQPTPPPAAAAMTDVYAPSYEFEQQQQQ